MVVANGYELAEDLIPEFERCVDEAEPEWFIMENVSKAPAPRQASHSAFLRDFDCGGLTDRVRRFSWAGLELDGLPEITKTSAPFPAVTGPGRVKLGGSGKLKKSFGRLTPTIAEACQRQGLPADFFDEDSPFTATAKREMVGQGVPLAMGLTIAAAVRRALLLEPMPAAPAAQENER